MRPRGEEARYELRQIMSVRVNRTGGGSVTSHDREIVAVYGKTASEPCHSENRGKENRLCFGDPSFRTVWRSVNIRNSKTEYIVHLL